MSLFQYYPLSRMFPQAQLSPYPYAQDPLMKNDRGKMVAPKLFIGLPHSLILSFSHEVEMDLYIPKHEKSHLDCLLVSQSLWSEVCSYVSVPPLSHRLESKRVRQPWPKSVLWTDSFTTICKWDPVVPTLIIPSQLRWVLETVLP